MGRSVNVDVYLGDVNVDIDLEDIDDDDLIEELRSRNIGGYEASDTAGDITEMFYAFRLGRDDVAMQLAKKIACDHTGRIL